MMNLIHQYPVKRAFLYSLIGSVCLSALLGIVTILTGNFSQFEIRILITTLTISAASLCGVACGAALESGRGIVLPAAGGVLAVVAAGMTLLGIWGLVESTEFWKTTATAQIFAVALAHISLMSLARLAKEFRWSQWGGYVSVLGVAMLLSSLFWGDFEFEWTGRFSAVMAILTAAFSIMIPVFHRLSRSESGHGFNDPTSKEVTSELAQIDQEISHLHTRLSELQLRRDQLQSANHQPGTSSSIP